MSHTTLQTALLLASLCLGLCVAADQDILFRASFEGRMDADNAAGESAPVQSPAIARFVPGVRGRAIRLSRERIHYLRAGNIRPSQGTVVFWMRPVDWAPEKKTAAYEWTFSVCGPGAGGDRIKFFKMPGPMLMFFAGREGHVKQLTHRIKHWPQGRWRFVALTWNAHNMKLFLDGQVTERAAVEPANAPVDPGRLIRLQSRATTDFDELRIFGRPLLEGEIFALYKKEAPPAHRPILTRAPEGRFRTPLAFRSKDKLMLVNWELNDPVRGPFTLRADVLDTRGEMLLSAAERVTGATAGDLRLDIARLRGLDYEVRTTLTTPQAEFVQRSRFKCYFNAEWIGFEKRLAKRHAVPKPWTPIRVEGANVATLTQQYTFAQNGMLRSARVADHELLASPVSLSMRTEQSPIRASGKRLWQEEHSDQVSFVVPLKADDAKGELRATTEFDGMIRYDLKLAPSTVDTRLTRLVLEIPLRADAATLKYPYRGPYQKWDVLDLPAEVKDDYADAFMPHIWVGNDDRGLAWFAPSDEQFEPASRNKVIELVRRGNAVVLRVNMVTFPRRLTVPITITFGLQATPARPLPIANWTAYGFSSTTATPRKNVTTGYTTGAEYHVLVGVPYPAKDPDRARRYVKAVHRDPTRYALVYATSNGMGGAAPQFRFFEQEWKNPIVCDTWSLGGRGQYHWGTCPTVTTLRDFFLWSTAKAIDAYGIDGLYYDYATVMRADNPAAGCGYERDGKRYPTWPIFADRELRKRVYQLFMEKRGRAAFVFHNYSKMIAPIASFCTVHLDGESYQRRTGCIGPRVTTDYTKLLSLARVRAMFGTQFGTVPYLLPKLAGQKADYGTPWIKKATRTLAALMLPHGVPIWGFYCDVDELNLYTAAQDRFGIGASHFTPYYKLAGELALAPSSAKMLVSYWRKPGAALIVVSNLADAAYQGRLTVEAKRVLGSSATRLRIANACTSSTAVTGGTRFPVSVPAKDYLLLEVTPEETVR